MRFQENHSANPFTIKLKVQKESVAKAMKSVAKSQKTVVESLCIFREAVGPYTVEVRKLTMRILELIGEGLGLEVGYFKEERSSGHGLVINYYPPCPEPSLALGIGAHCDAYLITLIQQNNYGLQITKKDGEWVGVDPLPNAFVVMIANQLQVLSSFLTSFIIHRYCFNCLLVLRFFFLCKI